MIGTAAIVRHSKYVKLKFKKDAVHSLDDRGKIPVFLIFPFKSLTSSQRTWLAAQHLNAITIKFINAS